MCNFMGVRVTKIQFIKLKQIEKELGTLAAMEELSKMMDGFKYSNALIVRESRDQDIEIVKAHWEFIPVWVKSWEDVKEARKQGIPWLNATSERLLESKMFRNAALNRRCLVIASHFYEWRHFQPEGALKVHTYPYALGLVNQDYFYMAGIWQPWTDKTTGETIDTFAIVTTQANELMQVVHNKKKRMPTILPEDLAYEWVLGDLTEDRIQEIASYQIPSEDMFAYTVARNFKIAEDPLTPMDYEELPGLDIAI